MTEANANSCAHCGLPVTGNPVFGGDGGGSGGEEHGDETSPSPVFCCVGCRAVYHTLQEAGLDDFYSLRQSWQSAQPRPVDTEVLDPDDVGIFDSSGFLGEHADVQSDGTMRAVLYLEGVHCAGCVWLVERMPRLLDGVVDARLELARGRMTVCWDPDVIELSEVARWLGQFGFEAHPLRTDNMGRRSRDAQSMLIRVGICWAVAANVMLMTIALYAGLDPIADGGLYTAVLWATFGLSAVSLVAGGEVFFRRALASFKSGRPSMDVPVSVGILVGWGHSGWATITGSGEVWFDSIVILIAALLTARYLQIRGNGLAADAADRLVALLPRMARRVVGFETAEQRVETVAAHTVEVGDRLHVLAGDVVPADGRVISGRTDISRAVLTGESLPESIDCGDYVEAGTTNLASPIVVEVEATGDETRVGRLMEWLEDRNIHRAPIVQRADRLSVVFITVVLVASVLTAVAWSFIDPTRVVANVVALLVIACPCALGMATPLALTVGVGQAARRGIHIKNDEVIEALDGVTDLVFDKTGTLTQGSCAVVDTVGDLEAIYRVRELEKRSNHPFAEAVVRWIDETVDPARGASDIDRVEDVEEIPGAGIRGIVDGRSVAVGRLSWFEGLPKPIDEWARLHAERGLTPVGVSIDGRVRAALAIGDRLRPEAFSILETLRKQGIRLHLLSGDHRRVVAATGRQLVIPDERVVGDATPEDKLAYIESLRERNAGAVVAMVGDGVNDAPALQAAHVGIAVHGGTEASLVAADIFIVADGVRPIAELLDGAKRTMAVVHRNLAGSGIYNFAGISLAALGFITPLLAAILMPISSLAVVASSLLQNSFGADRASAEQDAFGQHAGAHQESAHNASFIEQRVS